MKYVFALLVLMSSVAYANEIKISVKGMVCSFCAQGIEKSFKKESTVEKINVELEKNLVTLKLKSDQTLDDSKIKKIIEDAGYNVEKINR